MNPYYEADGVTLYHGEARTILPTISGPFAIVTDPPYGTGWARGGGSRGEFNAVHEQPAWDVWDPWYVNAPGAAFHAILCPWSRRVELAGLLADSAVAAWKKTNPRPLGPDRDALVLAPCRLPPGIAFEAYNGDTPFHPCQKPVDLMQWVLGFVPTHLTIVDPFAGSGSTLVAARALGRPCIGIEGDEAHCRTTVTRLSQGVLDLGGVA